MKPPYITIDTQGLATITAEATNQEERSRYEPTYKKKPVQFRLGRDLTLQLHGEHFEVKCQLDTDDTLSLIGILSYVLREKLYCDSLRAKQDGADA